MGVSINFLGSWVATGYVPSERVALQSYPENKYSGRESLESGEMKCDSSIRNDFHADDHIDQMKSNETIMLTTTKQNRLNSGQTGSRFEIDSLGRDVVVIIGISGSTVVLACYGDFSLLDAIAITLKEGQCDT